MLKIRHTYTDTELKKAQKPDRTVFRQTDRERARERERERERERDWAPLQWNLEALLISQLLLHDAISVRSSSLILPEHSCTTVEFILETPNKTHVSLNLYRTQNPKPKNRNRNETRFEWICTEESRREMGPNLVNNRSGSPPELRPGLKVFPYSLFVAFEFRFYLLYDF